MVSLLDLMFTVKNTKKGSNFFALFRFSTIFGWMFCSHIYLFLLYFCVRWMFCYHIYFFWLYFSVRGCFALRFMSTAKNTKKVTTFLLLCDFCSFTIFKHFSLYFFSARLMFSCEIHEHGQEHKKGNNFSSSLWFFCSSTICNYFSL